MRLSGGCRQSRQRNCLALPMTRYGNYCGRNATTSAKPWRVTRKLQSERFQKRIKNLIMTPKETPDGSVLEVTGDVELLRGGDVMLRSSLERTSEQYIGISASLSGIILTPAPLAA